MNWFALGLAILFALMPAVLAGSPKSQMISSYTDRNGQHPTTTTAKGPGTITCTDAEADMASQQQHNPNLPQYQCVCVVAAPGFTGELPRGQSAAISGPGIVVLTCRGYGKFVTCEASIKY